jgi:hypothetical protein
MTPFTFPILSKILFFFIRIPYLIAKFKVITTTQGIASPSAQGHETTRIDIALNINII